jgi:hypothetical protein
VARFRDLEAELQQFTVNLGSSPNRDSPRAKREISPRHFLGDLRFAWRPLGPPRPIQPEASPVTRDYSYRVER